MERLELHGPWIAPEYVKQKALDWCKVNECHYLSHEYYSEFDKPLWIAVEDYSGRYEVKVKL